MNYICTWLCADEKGEESLFPQTGQLSSSQSHQDIYWRCLIVFFITSKKFNKNEKHILFTNVKELPEVDGRSVAGLLKSMDVQVIHTGFKYKTPKGYYKTFQNQFYEFSILEHIALNARAGSDDDQYLIVDSDCVFLKAAQPIFQAALPTGFMSVLNILEPDQLCNGLSCNQMKSIYEELLDRPVDVVPPYHLGEFLLCSVANIKKIYADFLDIWPKLLERHYAGQQKFNEEAHTLSYLYFKNNLHPTDKNPYMKRIWTNPVFNRNVEETDDELILWHLPSEKTFGIKRLYDYLTRLEDFGGSMTDEAFAEIVMKKIGVPHLPLSMLIEYYTVSYYRAINKRLPWKKTRNKLTA